MGTTVEIVSFHKKNLISIDKIYSFVYHQTIQNNLSMKNIETKNWV